MVFHAFSIRMNKNRFEEDDGIDMNDIERFLPHLRSVSQMFFFLSFFGEMKSCVCRLSCRLRRSDLDPFIACLTLPPVDIMVESHLR